MPSLGMIVILPYRSDNVPSYVAAYLESSPRDPLAAEESSRKAANRVNEAAPRKVCYFLFTPKILDLRYY